VEGVTPYRIAGSTRTETLYVLLKDEALPPMTDVRGRACQPTGVTVHLKQWMDGEKWEVQSVTVRADVDASLETGFTYVNNWREDGPEWLPPLVLDIVNTRNGATS
jgi:hypothetical protein